MTSKFDPATLSAPVRKLHRRYLAPCSFCHTYAADRSGMVSAGDRETYICAECITEAARLLEQLPPSRGWILRLYPGEGG